jgi:chromatin segregation and condensation protein Rec8/ScpA/Scc1 (kleisin family)
MRSRSSSRRSKGPLDLLLYLIRKQNFNILDIPMASVTRQYLAYIEQIRRTNLELASDYLLMAAMLIEIKSRMLLPPRKTADGKEAEDPRAELVRRLVEYEQMKLAAARLDALPLLGRDFLRSHVAIDDTVGDAAARGLARRPARGLDRPDAPRQPGAAPPDLARAAERARAHEPAPARPERPALRDLRGAVRARRAGPR